MGTPNPKTLHDTGVSRFEAHQLQVIDGKEVVPIYVSNSKASVDGGVCLGHPIPNG